jgi:hypothetical protein
VNYLPIWGRDQGAPRRDPLNPLVKPLAVYRVAVAKHNEQRLRLGRLEKAQPRS